MTKPYVKVAITGGPSGGKTTLIEALKRELMQKCAVVPEAASILYRGGFPRLKGPAVMHIQRAIYHTQRELEEMLCETSNKSLIVCDRGSLDSVAYWPEDEEHFFRSLQTNKADEFARYDWVIHLDTASVDSYDTNNPIRTETHAEAEMLNTKILQAWEGHPRRVVISHSEDFLAKITTSLSVIQAIMAQRTADEIKQELLRN